MKVFWVGIGIVCVVIVVMVIFAYWYCNPSEEARSYMLGIIDKELRKATEGTPDYIEPNRNHLYFRNSDSLQTLRNAIKTARMIKFTGTPISHLPIVYVGEQEIGYVDEWMCCAPTALFWEYPAGTWWFAEMDDTYKCVLLDYIHDIGKEGSRRFKMVIPDECAPSSSIFAFFTSSSKFTQRGFTVKAIRDHP